MITETEISRKLGKTIPGPICVFTARGLGFDFEALNLALTPTWDRLPWDVYDVRLQKIEILERRVQTSEFSKEIARFYATGDEELLKPLLNQLPALVIEKLQSLQPFRKRALAKLNAKLDSNGWQITRLPADEAFEMDVPDKRKTPRKFAEMNPVIVDQTEFRELLVGNLEFIRKSISNVKDVTVFAHQMSTIALPNFDTTNSPEGKHQDGADFVVSAFVIRRKNITGGCSRLYLGNTEIPFFTKELQPGEGIFQVDANSEIYHDVTQISCTADIGSRDILGFDFHLN